MNRQRFLLSSCAKLVLSVVLVSVLASTTLSATDMKFERILAPLGTLALKQPSEVSFVIRNAGPQPAGAIECFVDIINLDRDEVVYSAQIAAVDIVPNEERTLTASEPFVPDETGSYLVQVNIDFDEEVAPDNNSGQEIFTVEPGLLTLEQAIAILNEDVVKEHPLRESIDVWHIRPPAALKNELIDAGSVIAPVGGGFELQYKVPVYLFFIDELPRHFFSHACQFVTVMADDGTVEVNDALMWPEIDGRSAVFGDICNDTPNPDRLQGQAVDCNSKDDPYMPVASENTSDWALVVVGRLRSDEEKQAVDHDICKFLERINGNSFGPGISDDNISIVRGTDGRGINVEELCTAITQLGERDCDKVYFKYIGHGLRRGLIFKDTAGTGEVTLPYSEIACKLEEAGIGNICIEVTACHSGGIVSHLEDKDIRGTVITSSNTSRTTPVGDGSGTHWEEALLQCSKSPFADLNRDSTIDNCELMAWVLTQNPTASEPRPQLKKLNDSVRSVRIRSDRVDIDLMAGNEGPLSVYAERICVRTRIRADGRTRNVTQYRTAVYIENEGNVRRRPNDSYSITARCDGRDTILVESIRPRLDPDQRVCVADVPDNCTRLSIDRVQTQSAKRDDRRDEVQAAGEPRAVEMQFRRAVHSPGDLILHRFVLVNETDLAPYQATASGPAAWDAVIMPEAFKMPESDSADVFIEARIPGDALEGGMLSAALYNTDAEDTLLIHYQSLLADTVTGATTSALQKNFRFITASGTWNSEASSFIDNSFIDVEDTFAVTADATGPIEMRNSVVNADSGSSLALHIDGGEHTFEGVGLRGMATALRISKGGNLLLRDVVVGNSSGDGIQVSGDENAGMQVDFLDVIGAAGNAVVFENLGPTVLRARGIRVLHADTNDIKMIGPGMLECLDCSFDPGKIDIDSRATLRRLATLSVAVRDSLDLPVQGVTIDVTDAGNNSVFSGLSDEDGMIDDVILNVAEYSGDGIAENAPFTVTMTNGDDTQSHTYSPEGFRQVVFTTSQMTTGVADANSKLDDVVISALYPQPAPSGSRVVCEIESHSAKLVQLAVYDVLGNRVLGLETFVNTGERTRVHLPTESLVAGVYVVRLGGVDGVGDIRVFVVK